MSRNAAYLLVARLISAGTTLLVLSYVGHSRGGAALGVVGVGMAIGALLSAATDAGTASLLIREGARDSRQLGRLLVAMSLWRILMVPVASGILWLLISATIETQPTAVLIVALGLALQQFAELTRAVFIARQEMHISSLHSAVENLAWMGVTLGLLATGASLEEAFLGGMAVFVASALLGFGLALFLGVGRLELPGIGYAARLIRLSGPFAAFMVVGVAYSRIDTLLIGALIPVGALAAAGAYFSAVRLLAGLEYIPEAISRAAYPRLARAFQEGPAALGRELHPAAAFLVVVGIPIPFVMLVAGPWIMTTAFGPDVAPYAWLLVPLGAALPLRFLGHLFGMTLTSSDAQGRRVAAVLVALGLVLLLDVVLIPLIGIAGAVIGSVAASAAVFTVYAAQVLRRAGSVGLTGLIIRCGVLAAGFGLLALALQSTVGPAVAGAITVAGYTAGLVILGHLPMPRRLRPAA